MLGAILHAERAEPGAAILGALRLTRPPARRRSHDRVRVAELAHRSVPRLAAEPADQPLEPLGVDRLDVPQVRDRHWGAAAAGRQPRGRDSPGARVADEPAGRAEQLALAALVALSWSSRPVD